MDTLSGITDTIQAEFDMKAELARWRSLRKS